MNNFGNEPIRQRLEAISSTPHNRFVNESIRQGKGYGFTRFRDV
jgi:hypothetical protein